ncbi:MAG: cytochrome C oxidase subunit IV family protein [Bacteroidetes bacterium]|nr:cytochrome C oxidase subunit IV family protein [Bacteroidota bacterium]HET6243198.1 cytochrome C oxidase subunit IV family protein [Bacteroidia bacterium]
MKRDDIIEYSLDAHHSEEEGVKKRKKIWQIFWILLIVTIVEVTLGLMFSRDPGMKTFLFVTFITLTLVKAGYIVMSYMHLGDEVKSLRITILGPFLFFIFYLIFISLIEATYIFQIDKLFGW